MNTEEESKIFTEHQEREAKKEKEVFSLTPAQLRELAGLAIFMASKIMDTAELNDFTTHIAMFLVMCKDKKSYEGSAQMLEGGYFDLDLDSNEIYMQVPRGMDEAVGRIASNYHDRGEDFTPASEALDKTKLN